MVAPAIGQVAAEFAITSDAVVAMTISVFILAHGRSCLSVENLLLKIDASHQAFGPLVLGPLSEVSIHSYPLPNNRRLADVNSTRPFLALRKVSK